MGKVIGIIFMIYLIVGLVVVGACMWYEQSTGQDVVTEVHNGIYAENSEFRCWNKKVRIRFTVVLCFVGTIMHVLTWPRLVSEIPYALRYLIKKIRNK